MLYLLFFLLLGCLSQAKVNETAQIKVEKGIDISTVEKKLIEYGKVNWWGTDNVKIENKGSYKGEFLLLEITLPNGANRELGVLVLDDDRILLTSPIPINISELYREMKMQEKREMGKIQKSERPKVTLAVMADCPYGNQMEEAMKDVIHLLSKYIDFEVRYIFYRGTHAYFGDSQSVKIENKSYWSLHGNYELNEGLREIAAFKLYGPEKWIDFATGVNEKCFAKNRKEDDCWKEVAESLEMNATKIEKYVEENYASLLENQTELTSDIGISASPTLLINNYSYSLPRNSEMIKEAICQAFLSMPEECNITLSSSSSFSHGTC